MRNLNLDEQPITLPEFGGSILFAVKIRRVSTKKA